MARYPQRASDSSAGVLHFLNPPLPPGRSYRITPAKYLKFVLMLSAVSTYNRRIMDGARLSASWSRRRRASIEASSIDTQTAYFMRSLWCHV